jgi:hypothetical protein
MATETSAADLVCWWPPPKEPVHERLVALLEALDGPDARAQTLGGHHQRLLQIHQAAIGTPLEAVVTCPNCGVENEFVVPVALILALPTPDPGWRAQVEIDGTPATTRLPTVDDLAETTGMSMAEAVRVLADRTCTPRPEPGPLGDETVRLLATDWERADPAAHITLDLACVSCDAELTVSVDPAEFVARDLDRHVSRLLGEVHTIASAYGWREGEILALPRDRRRHYLELIGTHPTGVRRTLTSVSS